MNRQPWYASFANYAANGSLPEGMNYQQRMRFLFEAEKYFWDEPYLYKWSPDQIVQRCIPEEEQPAILDSCHGSDYGGHFSGKKTALKVLHSGFFWPSLFKDAAEWAKQCDSC